MCLICGFLLWFYEGCSDVTRQNKTLSLFVAKPNVIVTSHQAFLTREVRFARNRVLLLLREWLPCIPRLTDLFARDIVSALELVEDARVQFRRIYLAVFGQHGLLRNDIGDLAHDAVHRLGRHDLSQFLTSQSCSSSGCTLWRRTSIRRRSSGEEGRP